jgi:uncharacterized protein (DUF1501 family)
MTPPWTTCEGGPTRRTVLTGSLTAALALWAGRSALAQVTLGAKDSKTGNVLVTLFLRGGMDGLSMIVPHGDDGYHKARPSIGLGVPKRGAVRDLDGFFGLHPALAPLEGLYKDGALAPIHAIGSLDQSRSHFEAMALMERGAASDPAAIPSGWLARHLQASPTKHASPLRAVAFDTTLPDILRGATNASTIRSLEDIKLAKPSLHGALARLYAHGDDPVQVAGRETLAVLRTLDKLDPARYRPENGALYPDSALGKGLQQTALLIKADVGVEVACLDRGGWDTHVAQGGATGWLSTQLDDVARSLAAFAADLGRSLDGVTVVVMTEFGRRVAENSGLGTDHGRASSWLLLGGGVSGGRVFARWPGCAPDKLEAPGDLKVTTDYRDVLSELVTKRLGGDGRALFPGAPGQGLGAFG